MGEELTFKVQNGFEPEHKEQAIRLFWDAFKGKLHPVMKPEEKALNFLRLVADSNHAISAVNDEGELLGIAGYKTRNGSFIGGDLKEICSIYGPMSGTVRGIIMSFLERPLQPGTLLMDGIFVSKQARGQGIGSALLSALKSQAQSEGFKQVRLDVIDTNPRARALYERHGFIAGKITNLGPLRYIFGFQSATTMVCEL